MSTDGTRGVASQKLGAAPSRTRHQWQLGALGRTLPSPSKQKRTPQTSPAPWSAPGSGVLRPAGGVDFPVPFAALRSREPRSSSVNAGLDQPSCGKDSPYLAMTAAQQGGRCGKLRVANLLNLAAPNLGPCHLEQNLGRPEDPEKPGPSRQPLPGFQSSFYSFSLTVASIPKP